MLVKTQIVMNMARADEAVITSLKDMVHSKAAATYNVFHARRARAGALLEDPSPISHHVPSASKRAVTVLGLQSESLRIPRA